MAARYRASRNHLKPPYRFSQTPSEHFDDRRTLLRLAFPQRLRYARDQSFLNQDLALPFKVLHALKEDKLELAPRPELNKRHFSAVL